MLILSIDITFQHPFFDLSNLSASFSNYLFVNKIEIYELILKNRYEASFKWWLDIDFDRKRVGMQGV